MTKRDSAQAMQLDLDGAEFAVSRRGGIRKPISGVCQVEGCSNPKPRRQGSRYCEHHKMEKAAKLRSGTRNADWGCEEDALLGTQPDGTVARLIGRTAKAVGMRRNQIGVDQYRRPARKQNGYLITRLKRDHRFYCMTRGKHGARGEVMAHRLAMAEHLDRPLASDEFVHHRNGIKDDNRIENLELWTRAHPDGQRIEDVLNWCFEFIERYAKELS